MVLEGLGGSLREVLRKIARASHVDQGLVSEVVRDLQRALLQADIKVEMALQLSRQVEKRALTEKPPAGMSGREHVIHIIYEELVRILGQPKDLRLGKQRILLVGLYGQGKTTTVAKLGKWFQKKGLKVGMIQADTHRPAAYDQLEQLAERLETPFYGDPAEKNAIKVARSGLKRLADQDVIIVDSSGRHALEADLIEEIKEVSKAVNPDETILILDASTGQQAGPQAKAFHEAVRITAVVVTKLDGSAKGGGAISAVAETGAPICFVGVGERIEDLEKFEPPRFISRLLGMGDIQSLLERAQEALDQEQLEETARKLLSGRFTLREMYEQMEALTKMGPLSKVFSMLPGMPDVLSEEQMEETQGKLRKFRFIMDSMTEYEKENPKTIKSSRILRIARGSGTDPKDVKELLKYYNASKRAIRGLAGNRKMRRQLMKQFKAGGFDLGDLGR
ncbi:MAG: signal recognition particle protein Srp54 [Candidatus Thermoplasmatota archaeon]|nr:signal recognition particle protein Srp54 [Candidatus Thermoplasmatota archaeon]